MQRAYAVLSSVACPALQYFSTSHKRYDFRKKKSYWTQNVCCDFIYNCCLKHFSFYEELTEIWSKMYNFNGTSIFSTDVRKITEVPNFHENPSIGSRQIFMKIHQLGADKFSWKSINWEPTNFHENPWIGSRQIFMKIHQLGADNFSWKSINLEPTNFHENPSIGSRQIFMKFHQLGADKFSWKSINWEPTNFHENPFIGSRADLFRANRRMDRQTWWT